MGRTRGWILDLYPGKPGEMVVWVKREDGEAIRLVDRWSPSIFIGTDNKADFDVPLHALRNDFIWTRTVQKRERVTDASTSLVVEARLKDAKKAKQVAGRIERLGQFGTFRLYNADVPPGQSYLYERDLFPLAHCEVEQKGEALRWELKDDVWAYDYALPDLRKVKIEVDIAKQGKLPRLTDRIAGISLESDKGKVEVGGHSEADKLLELVKAVREADPDFVLTNDGDTFLFPYLIKRAEASGISAKLVLDRDGVPTKLPSKGGTSYFSYGRIHYKPSPIKLCGRVHIDINTSFAYSEAGFDGLFELSRICRMPLHTSSRASIGKALSSLQFYHASKIGLLVPWKPTLVEHFKDRNELLMADRGGFIFEPKVGVHENVGELDFSALYPNIMYRKNISAETVKCACCPDSDNRVPELGWNVCKRRDGIVPLAIKIIVEKRLHYKELKRVAKGADYARYNAKQAALKWLGVTTFGYLGFNNAKFGRIDAHIAVCAWDRKILLDTARIAERNGFEVMHGIVDSLWVQKAGADRDDYLELKTEIEAETGFAISLEGIYKWVAFLPSKAEPNVPVLNRYFGVYQTGDLKIRGIEARRHDTPLAFARCQMEILKILGKANTIAEAKAKISECTEIFLHHAEALARHDIPASELAFSTNLSKAPEEYTTMTVQHAAIEQLVGEGAALHAGEGIRYVVTDYKGRDSKRATPIDMINDQTKYDSERYIVLLAETCSSVLEPFDPGCTTAGLLSSYEARRSGPLG
ncbi:MAG TPA: DNA polymerase domain-containing protein [Nitrososphaerales archaeon]|nr:DNA polymerase domain-containing protein [Nitrososphaerales archaeon]